MSLTKKTVSMIVSGDEIKFFKSIYDCVNAPVFISDISSDIIYSNPVAQNILLLKPDKTDINRIFHTDSFQKYSDSVKNLSTGKTIDLTDIQIRTSNGNSYLCDLKISIVSFSGKDYYAHFPDIKKENEEGGIRKLLSDLKADNDRYKILVENQSDGIVIADVDDNFRFSNEAANRIFGTYPNSLVGKNVKEFIRDKSQLDQLESETQSRIKGKKSQYKLEIFSPDGDRKIISISVNPKLNQDGKFEYSFGIIRDITELDNALNELTISENKYKSLFDNAIMGIVIISMEGEVLEYNDSMKRLFNLPEDYSGDFGLKDAYFDYSEREYYLEKLCEDKIVPEHERRFRNFDGNEIWLLMTLRLIQYDGLPAIQATATDITTRKLIEDEIKEQSARMKSLLENTSDMIWAVNNSYELIVCNNNAYEIYLHLTGQKINLGQNFVNSQNENFNSLWKERFDKCLNNIIYSVEDTYKFEDIELTIETSFNPIKFEKQVIGVSCFSRDITDRKKSEEETRKLIEELQWEKDTVEENANQMHKLNLALTKSEDELIKSNAAKDKFFSIIAHDLRSPISGFMGLSEALAKDFRELNLSQIKEIGQGLHSSANQLFRLLENLLQWSRTQTGDIPYNPDAVDLFYFIRDTVYLYQNNANEKDIELIANIDKGNFVWADINHVETIIRNLTSNAIKFTRKGGTVEVSTKQVNDFISISISDNGIGIPKEKIDELFQLGKNSTTPGTSGEKGSGLGLLLCRELVEKNGGKMFVDSEIGKGTVFSFTLPLPNYSKL